MYFDGFENFSHGININNRPENTQANNLHSYKSQNELKIKVENQNNKKELQNFLAFIHFVDLM